MKKRIKINKKTGAIECLGDIPFEVGKTKQERFSEIIPTNIIAKATFRLLRKMFGEKGLISDWTRSWPCRWRLIILQGKSRGLIMESDCRQDLLRAEKEIWFQPIVDL